MSKLAHNITFRRIDLTRFSYFNFLAFIFFLSFTKLSIPSFGSYEITISDLLIAILFLLTAFTFKGIKRNFIFPILFLVSLVLISCASVIMIKSFKAFYLALLPFVIALLIFVTLTLIMQGFQKGLLFKIRKVLCSVLVLSSLPAFYELITGVKLVYFYDYLAWRYTFLCQNPNQYGVSTIVFIYLITYITIAYDRRFLPKLLLLQMILFVPILYSGSRSSTIVFFLNFVLIFSIYAFSRFSLKKVVLNLLLFFTLISFSGNFVDFIKSKGGNIARALTIFDVASGKKELDLNSVGHSIDSAKELFIDHPILGIGLGNKRAYVGGIEIHNTFWLFIAETGIIGFMSFLLLFFGPVLIAFFYMRNNVFKFYFILSFVLFSAQNYTGMLLRQRWVWTFLCLSYIIVIYQIYYPRSQVINDKIHKITS